MRNGNFTDETIEQAKLSLCDTLCSVEDGADEIDSWFKAYCASGEFFPPDEISKLIKKVSREEIVVAASMVTKDTVFILESNGEENKDE